MMRTPNCWNLKFNYLTFLNLSPRYSQYFLLLMTISETLVIRARFCICENTHFSHASFLFPVLFCSPALWKLLPPTSFDTHTRRPRHPFLHPSYHYKPNRFSTAFCDYVSAIHCISTFLSDNRHLCSTPHVGVEIFAIF